MGCGQTDFKDEILQSSESPDLFFFSQHKMISILKDLQEIRMTSFRPDGVTVQYKHPLYAFW